ncbi:FtsX-like permease family protein [Catenulispora yoronensis]
MHALATVPGTGGGFAALRAPYRLTRTGQAVAAQGGLDKTTPTADVLGLDPAASQNVVVLRPDQAGGKSWQQLSALLAGDGWDADGAVGAAVPGTPSLLSTDVTYTWDGTGTGTPCALGALHVVLQFTDAHGFPGSVDLGTVDRPDGVPHRLTGRLDPAATAYPIRITSVAESFPPPLCPAVVAVPPADGVTIALTAPAFDGKPLALPKGLTYGIPYQASDADVIGGVGPGSTSQAPDGRPVITTAADGSAAFTYTEHIGYTAAGWTAKPVGESDLERATDQLRRVFELGPATTGQPVTVPAIATGHLLAALDKNVGDTFLTSAFKQPVRLRFVAAVTGMPGGGPGTQDALIVPLGLLAHELQRPSLGPTGDGQQLAPMTGEWWAAVGAGNALSVARQYRTVLTAARLPRPPVVEDRESETASRRDYPFAAGFSLTLELGTAAALAFVLLGLALHTVSALRERAAELAILDALGLTRRRAALLLLAEQAGIALFGALAGLGLAWLALRSEFKLMVFTPSGAPPTPPAVQVFDWPTLAVAAPRPRCSGRWPSSSRSA